MNQYYLNLFVRFTCKILLRSKALWVCALLTFCCVNLFQIYFQSNFIPDASPIGFTAELRNYAFPELMPYMSVYLFSVLQTIILLFFFCCIFAQWTEKRVNGCYFLSPGEQRGIYLGNNIGLYIDFRGYGTDVPVGWRIGSFVME